MGLADPNKRVHIGGLGGGEGGRKIVLFYKRLQAYPYILSLEILWEKEKKYLKRSSQKAEISEGMFLQIQTDLFVATCSFQFMLIYANAC